MTPTPIIPKADEVRVMSRETRFMSPVVVTDPRTGKPIAVMKDDPEGRYVHWTDAYARCSAPSPAVGGEKVGVTDEEVDRFLKTNYRDIDWNYGTIEDALQACYPHVVRGWVRAALEAFVRGRGKS